MFNHFTLTWPQFKDSIDNQHMQWQFIESDDRYDIFGMEGSLLFYTLVLKDSGADQTDFETNYKSSPTGLKHRMAGLDGSGDIQELKFSGTRVEVETSPATGSIQEIVIVDPLYPTTRKANVDPSGRLQVSTQTPAPPTGTTPVIQEADGNLGNNATSNVYYTIPSGEDLVIQRLLASGEGGAQNGWFFELYYDPNGVGGATSPVQGSWELISFIVIQENGGSTFFDTGNETFTGNGTRRIVLRRIRRGGGGSKRGFIQFTGYY